MREVPGSIPGWPPVLPFWKHFFLFTCSYTAVSWQLSPQRVLPLTWTLIAGAVDRQNKTKRRSLFIGVISRYHGNDLPFDHKERGIPCRVSGTNCRDSVARMQAIHLRDELDMLYFTLWDYACCVICSKMYLSKHFVRWRGIVAWDIPGVARLYSN